MKKSLTVLIFLFTSFFVRAQEKAHFKIHKIDASVDLGKYQKAADGYIHLDQFRFYDRRRTIHFSDGKASIEIYSAKELQDIYGKPVAPSTIMNHTKAREITFDITIDGNGLKPQILK